MGRKNSNVRVDLKRTYAQYRHRRNKRIKFNRFAKRLEREEKRLLFLEAKSRKKKRKDSPNEEHI